MRVAVLGSGSRGNAVLLASGATALLIDAGFGARTLERRARAVGIDLAELSGIILTHEHGDHARGAARLAQRVGCAVHGSPGTLAALAGELDGVECHPLLSHTAASFGPLSVEVCRTSHDAAESLAVAATETATGRRVAIAYDLGRPTQQVRYLLRGANCLVLEANHDDMLLRTGPYPAAVRERIAGPGGHLSNREAAELAAELCHPGLRTVVLAHLSDRCNRAELAVEAVRGSLAQRGFRGSVVAALQDEPLPMLELATEQYALEGLD
jgi:phosphoribosyl 1,2-cyclic phosphodiesterase